MPNQTGHNFLVAFNEETTFNVSAATSGAQRVRANASGGLRLTRTELAPNEIRGDGMTSMGRMGSRSVAGSYSADGSVGTFDRLFQAALRSTWVPLVEIAYSTAHTSITTTTNTIVAASGSFITSGFRVGDVIKLTGTATPANNNRNLRLTGVTASTLTVAETLTANATADALVGGRIVRSRRLLQGVVRRSFTVEEHATDLDITELFTGCRVSSMRVSLAPDGYVSFEFSFAGADMTPLASASSPYFATPVLTTSIPMTAADAVLRFGGSDVLALTGFDVTVDLRAAGMAVIGSNITPDVWENSTRITGSISAIRSDVVNVTRALAETELEFHALFVEPNTEPKNFLSLFLPRIKITVPEKSLGGDGAQIETMSFMAAAKDPTVGYDTTMILLSTSAV